MDEREVVENTDEPRTVKSLKKDLVDEGVGEAEILLVHSSLSSLGWVCGGAQAVVEALVEVVSPGTFVMPTFSGGLSDPSDWENPPVPESWWETIRAEMPAFDPEVTPIGSVGMIPEVFRKWPNVVRGSHPIVSFAALGPDSEDIVEDHPLDFPLGEDSPLARLYELDAKVLLLGVGFDRNTSFHLGEYRAPGKEETVEAGPVEEDGERIWKEYKDIKFKDDKFEEMGEEFEEEEDVKIFKVGSAKCRYFSIRDAVDFSERWFSEFRESNSDKSKIKRDEKGCVNKLKNIAERVEEVDIDSDEDYEQRMKERSG